MLMLDPASILMLEVSRGLLLRFQTGNAGYYDFQLHVEFNISPGGNSGVYMRDKYEIQILDSFGKPPAESGCGALYRRYAPATNASRKAGTWQTYDVTFIGRRLTVDHNGIRVLDNINVGPKGTGAASDRPDGPGPLRLQGDHGKVFFRNVRIRPLSPEEAKKIQKQIESSLGWMGLLAQEPSLTAPFYADKQNLLRYLNRQGVGQEVRTRSDWDVRRGHILENMQRVMGRLPSGRSAPLDLQVLEPQQLPGFKRQKITFVSERLESGPDRVPAYLLIPSGLRRGTRVPAMLCLHQTTRIGKGEPAGVGGKPDLQYAAELARRGYVTLAPDYPNFGDYTIDPYANGYASATMKGIVNHRRAVDLLQSLPQVDPERIGVIGHSLGGHNAFFLAAFEQRIKVVVTSCGFNSFQKYKGGDLTGWSHRGYMPRIAEIYSKDAKQMPFDFTEVLGQLGSAPGFYQCACRRR